MPTSDPPTPRSQADNRAKQQREQDQAARAKEKKIGRQERLDRYNADYWLREQQGLSPPSELVLSSSDEEEGEEEQTTSGRWDPAPPPSPGAEEVAAEPTPEAGTAPPVEGSSVRTSAGSAGVPPEPSRKRKRGFSGLRCVVFLSSCS